MRTVDAPVFLCKSHRKELWRVDAQRKRQQQKQETCSACSGTCEPFRKLKYAARGTVWSST